jgi:CRISPR-associated endonuclease/helicase Cas3
MSANRWRRALAVGGKSAGLQGAGGARCKLTPVDQHSEDALCSLAPEERQDEITAGRPWAKSGIDKPLRFEGGVAFRHELASLLILDGPLSDLLSGAPDTDLAKYLVLAHHGKLRVQARDPGDLAVLAAGEASGHKLLGSAVSAPGPAPRSCSATGTGRSSSLAYLETIVRVADWRASAGSELARWPPSLGLELC